MGKLSRAALNVPQPNYGPLQTGLTPSGLTGNGAEGFAYDDKSALFLLAVSNFVGEDTFYEDAKGRDTRYVELIRRNATTDPRWTAEFLRWLRHEANMRSASIVGAVEAAKAISEQTGPRFFYVAPRQIMDSVLRRADEPAEALGYWLANHGRKVPKWLKRALGDAILRLYTPYNVLKWDSERNPVRMADVVEFSQIEGKKDGLYRRERDQMFKYLLDARHGRGDASEIPMLAVRKAFNEIDPSTRRQLLGSDGLAEMLSAAGLTWEAVSGWLGGPMDAAAWESCIPIMGYGALIKNLANFERAGISAEARRAVTGLLSNRTLVRKSRLLPMAFLNAYNHVPGDTYRAALDEAATYATLDNVPEFAGRTLILVDTSGSMNTPFTTRRNWLDPNAEMLMRWDAAALFGIALSMRCEHADVVSFSAAGFGINSFRSSTRWTVAGKQPWGDNGGRRDLGFLAFNRQKGENLLRAVARFRKTHFIGGGTDTHAAIRSNYSSHDRVVILTDEQADPHRGHLFDVIPIDVPAYTFNLAGYAHGHAATVPNRYVVGGLSDKAFTMLGTLESTRSGNWPWEQTAVV